MALKCSQRELKRGRIPMTSWSAGRLTFVVSWCAPRPRNKADLLLRKTFNKRDWSKETITAAAASTAITTTNNTLPTTVTTATTSNVVFDAQKRAPWHCAECSIDPHRRWIVGTQNLVPTGTKSSLCQILVLAAAVQARHQERLSNHCRAVRLLAKLSLILSEPWEQNRPHLSTVVDVPLFIVTTSCVKTRFPSWWTNNKGLRRRKLYKSRAP